MSHPWRPHPTHTFTVEELATKLGLPVPSYGQTTVLTNVQPLLTATASQLSFLENPSYAAQAAQTKAGAVLVQAHQARLLPAGTVALVTPRPYVHFAQALAMFYPAEQPQGIHPTAVIHPTAMVAADVTIGAGSVIGAGVQIGPGTTIGALCVLHKCSIGTGCLLHPGVKVGQDGFGFAQQGTTLIKVPQVGGVIIGHYVEIGANSTIDCGALADTIIEDHVKIDNLVQIAHNAHIGAGTRIVAQCAIAGSARVGQFNVIGGQSGIAGHLTTAAGVMVAARSGVTKSIPTQGSIVAGYPAQPIAVWRRSVAVLNRLAKKAGKDGEGEPNE